MQHQSSESSTDHRHQSPMPPVQIRRGMHQVHRLAGENNLEKTDSFPEHLRIL